ncbi:MAG: lipopolysaccharide biosynthesis protein [Chitinophagaceae bacterium]
MGIIRKQSIYSSIFIYIGFAIGAVNVLILFPKFIGSESYGLTRVLLDFGLLFSTICTFGSIPVTLKFYPFYTSYLSKKQNDLPSITLAACIIGCILFLLLTTIFKEEILRKFGSRSPLFVTHFNLIYPLTLSYAFFTLMESYAWALKKTILSNFLKEVLFRLITTILIALYVFSFITIETFFNLYAFIYFPSLIILFIVIIRSGNFPVNFSISSVTKRLYKKMMAFGFFLFSSAMLNVLSRTIDVIVIASQSVNGLTDAAIFTIPTYLVTIMDVPQRSMVAIATPIISEAWKDRNKEKILELYQKTSLNLLIIGLALGGIIYLNMDNAIKFLGNTYKPAKEIALIMGIAKLIDLGTGLNSQILQLSKYWKIDFITNMLFILLALPLNYTLINTFGVTGAAYANLIAITVFNSVRFIYIWKLFKLQPFTINTLYAFFIAFFCIGIVYFIPAFTNLYIDIIVRTIIFFSMFSFAVIYFKPSEDLSALFQIFVGRIKQR